MSSHKQRKSTAKRLGDGLSNAHSIGQPGSEYEGSKPSSPQSSCFAERRSDGKVRRSGALMEDEVYQKMI